MVCFLNQIFYENQKFDANNIHLMNKWSLTPENMDIIKDEFIKSPESQSGACEHPLGDWRIKSVDVTPFRNKQQLHDISQICDTHLVQERPIVESTNVIFPHQEDSLFWCAFIANYGYSEFTTIRNKFKNREIEEKQKIIDYILRSPKCLKSSNIKISIAGVQEIQSGLMTNSKTSLDMFIAICSFYRIRVFIENPSKLSFLDFNPDISNDELPLHIISISENGKYSICIDSDSALNKKNTIIEQFIKLESPSKPFMGIASYKVADLEIIADKVDVDKKVNKTVLYRNILDKCAWKF